MQESHLLVFVKSRPFEPFRIFVADGRRIDVRYPEMMVVAKYVVALWLFHATGQIEVVETSMITGLKTIGPVDSGEFAGSQLDE